MKITMKSIAERLGVSRTTISLVLQGRGDESRISRSTQQRITEAARDLGFRPSYLATALNKGVTDTIGVVFPNIFEEFMGTMIRGIEDVLYAAGSLLLFSTSRFDNSREAEIVYQLLHRRADGIIIAAAAPFTGTKFDYTHVRQVVAEGIPLVMLDRYIPDIEACRVVQDDEGLTFQAVEMLYRQGLRRIACLSFDLEITSLRSRILGWQRAKATFCDSGDYEESPLLLPRSQDPASNDLKEIINEMIEHKSLPDAFMVTTSGIAEKLGILLEKSGVIPGVDIIICRFSAQGVFRPKAAAVQTFNLSDEKSVRVDSSDPKAGKRNDILTGSRFVEIRQPNYELGCTAAEELVGLIRSGEPNSLKTILVGQAAV
jgi:LacI family transcriptional regulator